MEMKPYIVYAKINAGSYIAAVNSSVFMADTTGWTEIDTGYGDKYHHAQGNYFPKPILTMHGAYRYKLVNAVPVECTLKEIMEQETASQPMLGVPSLENRVEMLELNSTEMKKTLDLILSGVTE